MIFRRMSAKEQVKPQGVPPKVALHEWQLWLLLVVSVAAMTLSYQGYNGRYLFTDGSMSFAYMGSGWYDHKDADGYGRWTDGKGSITFRNFGVPLGDADFNFKFNVYGDRSNMQGTLPPPTVTILLGRQVVGTISTKSSTQGYGKNYELSVPASLLRANAPDPEFTLLSTTFTPPSDTRKLGIKVWRAELSATSGFILPPPWLLLVLVLYGPVEYVLQRRIASRNAALSSTGVRLFLLVALSSSSREVIHLYFIFFIVITLLTLSVFWWRKQRKQRDTFTELVKGNT